MCLKKLSVKIGRGSMERMIYVQTILTESELEKLMKKAGTNNKKDALRRAVLHYLACDYDVEED